LNKGHIEIKLLKSLKVNVYFTDNKTYFQNSYEQGAPTIFLKSQENTSIERVDNIGFFKYIRRTE